MALGNSSLNKVRTNLENIDKDIKYGNYNSGTNALYSCWNTFDYVSKNLGEWANDTIIGQNSKQDLTKLSNLLSQLIDETRVLQSKINAFCDKQDSVNGTRSRSNNREIANPSFTY